MVDAQEGSVRRSEVKVHGFLCLELRILFVTLQSLLTLQFIQIVLGRVHNPVFFTVALKRVSGLRQFVWNLLVFYVLQYFVVNFTP